MLSPRLELATQLQKGGRVTKFHALLRRSTHGQRTKDANAEHRSARATIVVSSTFAAAPGRERVRLFGLAPLRSS